MEMIVEGFGTSNKDLIHFNRVRKHQQATFLSDTTTANGDKIDTFFMSDWRKIHKGSLEKNRSTTIFET